jgi:hypothetical protein
MTLLRLAVLAAVLAVGCVGQKATTWIEACARACQQQGTLMKQCSPDIGCLCSVESLDGGAR